MKVGVRQQGQGKGPEALGAVHEAQPPLAAVLLAAAHRAGPAAMARRGDPPELQHAGEAAAEDLSRQPLVIDWARKDLDAA